MTATVATLYALGYDIQAADDFKSTPPNGSDKILLLGGWVKWGGGIACVIGLIAVFGAMALQHRRGSGGEHGAAFGWVALASIGMGVASGIVTALGA